MADLSITAGNVVAGTGATTAQGTSGETITAGQTVYKAASSRKWMKADSNSATAEARTPSAVALNSASLNQPITVQTLGDITIGATLTPGLAYYQSDTPGGICPVADVGSGEYVTLLGLATSSSVLALKIQSSGTAN